MTFYIIQYILNSGGINEMKKIVILTGSELRHTFVRKYIALDHEIQVLGSFCEGTEKSLATFVGKQKEEDSRLRKKHLRLREQSESDFFELFVSTTEDHSNPVFLLYGEINNPEYVEKVISLKPDLIVAYGCSLIKEPLILAFEGRFLNVHLGLSPYYRGSGTNYWPLVMGQPELVGVTFMHIDPGIDTGEIIHQIRARVFSGDTPSSIGNRLIVDMAKMYRMVVKKIDFLPKPKMVQPQAIAIDKVYRQKDYNEASVEKLYSLFKEGLIERYLGEIKERELRFPIVSNPILTKMRKP